MPSRSAVSFAGGAPVLRPRPRGASGRVSRAVISWRAASRSSTSAPNGAVAATASFTSANDDPRPQRAHRLAARLGRRPVDDQLAVEVVELVLRDARGHSFEVVARPRRPARRCPRCAPRSGRSTGTVTPWIERQPSSSRVRPRRLATSSGLTSDCNLVLGRREDEHAPEHADLSRGEPDAVRVLHQLLHARCRAGVGRRRTPRPGGPPCAGRGRGTGGSCASARLAPRKLLGVELLVPTCPSTSCHMQRAH